MAVNPNGNGGSAKKIHVGELADDREVEEWIASRDKQHSTKRLSPVVGLSLTSISTIVGLIVLVGGLVWGAAMMTSSKASATDVNTLDKTVAEIMVQINNIDDKINKIDEDLNEIDKILRDIEKNIKR